MKILILGAGKMGSFFCDVLSSDHEVAIFDIDPIGLNSHSGAIGSLRWTKCAISSRNS